MEGTPSHRLVAGFTLMEVIVAMAIVLIALAGISALFRSSITGFFKTKVDIELQAETSKIASLIANDLKKAKLISKAKSHALSFTDAEGSPVEYVFDSSRGELLRNYRSVSSVAQVLHSTFTYFGNDPALDKNRDGVVDFEELDQNSDWELMNDELEKITLIRFKITVQYKDKTMETSSSAKILVGK